MIFPKRKPMPREYRMSCGRWGEFADQMFHPRDVRLAGQRVIRFSRRRAKPFQMCLFRQRSTAGYARGEYGGNFRFFGP